MNKEKLTKEENQSFNQKKTKDGLPPDLEEDFSKWIGEIVIESIIFALETEAKEGDRDESFIKKLRLIDEKKITEEEK